MVDSENKNADPVDIYVGSRVRMRRIILGMSQEKLAEALGLSFQQVQKYEKGKNRIGSSRLQSISEILGVPIQFFFEGAPSTVSIGNADLHMDFVTEFITTDEGLTIARAFSKIKDARLKRRIADLVEGLTAENR
jgi:transcriptional regulator with XRE-family HTH domain